MTPSYSHIFIPFVLHFNTCACIYNPNNTHQFEFSLRATGFVVLMTGDILSFQHHQLQFECNFKKTIIPPNYAAIIE